MNKREVGAAYERQAADYAQRMGMRIIAQNYRCRLGEIDLILLDGQTLVFAEVKYRQDSRLGHPEDAVDVRKQRKICRVADYYRMQNHVGYYTPIRYDVAAIYGDGNVVWLKNAFWHIGSEW